MSTLVIQMFASYSALFSRMIKSRDIHSLMKIIYPQLFSHLQDSNGKKGYLSCANYIILTCLNIVVNLYICAYIYTLIYIESAVFVRKYIFKLAILIKTTIIGRI